MDNNAPDLCQAAQLLDSPSSLPFLRTQSAPPVPTLSRVLPQFQPYPECSPSSNPTQSQFLDDLFVISQERKSPITPQKCGFLAV